MGLFHLQNVTGSLFSVKMCDMDMMRRVVHRSVECACAQGLVVILRVTNNKIIQQ